MLYTTKKRKINFASIADKAANCGDMSVQFGWNNLNNLLTDDLSSIIILR